MKERGKGGGGAKKYQLVKGNQCGWGKVRPRSPLNLSHWISRGLLAVLIDHVPDDDDDDDDEP